MGKKSPEQIKKKETIIRRKHWMIENTFELIEKRENLVVISIYKETISETLDREIKKTCKNDKNDHITIIYTEL